MKMVFSEDKFYNDRNKPIYEAGKLCDVPANMVDRWMKRGGRPATESELKSGKVVLEAAAPAPVAPESKAAPEPVKSASWGDNEDDEQEKLEEDTAKKKGHSARRR